MQNTNKLPTLNELKEKVFRDNIEFGENYEILEYVVEELLYILEKNPKFHNFLVKNDFSNYELPTSFFAQIIYYIEECLKNNNIKEIKKLLYYLNKLIKKGDKEFIDLICVGFLENLDNYKYVLTKTIKLMPKNLKELFMEFYSDYLD